MLFFLYKFFFFFFIQKLNVFDFVILYFFFFFFSFYVGFFYHFFLFSFSGATLSAERPTIDRLVQAARNGWGALCLRKGSCSVPVLVH